MTGTNTRLRAHPSQEKHKILDVLQMSLKYKQDINVEHLDNVWLGGMPKQKSKFNLLSDVFSLHSVKNSYFLITLHKYTIQ